MTATDDVAFDQAVAYFRSRELSFMARGAGNLRRPNGGTLNQATAVFSPTAPAVYTGAGYVRPATLRDQDVTTGDANVRVENYTLKLPVDTDVRIGDIWTQTTSLDASMASRSFRVVEVKADDWEITRRCLLTEDAVT